MSWQRDMNRSRMAEAALTNEQVTRERVDVLEAQAKGFDRGHHALEARVAEVEAVVDGGLWARLLWLFLGR